MRDPGGDAVNRFSVLLVAVAATMWATDVYFRSQLVTHLTASQIVVAEDGLITLFVLPLLWSRRAELRRLGSRGWTAAGLIAVGPQAIATVLFTASFAYGNYQMTYVLQQTQPLIAITLAWLILGERRRPWFWAAVGGALAGVYMVVFAPDLTAPLSAFKNGQLLAALEALGAAVLWAGGTVLGRVALSRVSFPAMTGLRFSLALPVLVAIVLVQNGISGFSHYRPTDVVPNLLAIALIPGLFALLIYYRGLASTPASIATIAEMAYPVAITLVYFIPPPIGFGKEVLPFQIVGTVVLMAVILLLNWSKEQPTPVVLVRKEPELAAS